MKNLLMVFIGLIICGCKFEDQWGMVKCEPCEGTGKVGQYITINTHKESLDDYMRPLGYTGANGIAEISTGPDGPIAKYYIYGNQDCLNCDGSGKVWGVYYSAEQQRKDIFGF